MWASERPSTIHQSKSDTDLSPFEKPWENSSDVSDRWRAKLNEWCSQGGSMPVTFGSAEGLPLQLPPWKEQMLAHEARIVIICNHWEHAFMTPSAR